MDLFGQTRRPLPRVPAHRRRAATSSCTGPGDQLITSSSSMTSVTPLAIQVAPTTASCSAQVRTWPVSLTALPKVSAATSLSSGISAAGQGVLNVLFMSAGSVS